MARLMCACLLAVVVCQGVARAESPAVGAQALALHQYFYVDFPRAVQAVVDERTLLEAEVKALELRVAGYRPFRSFRQYGATYTADIGWQLELLAARQRLAWLANTEADLWRERSLVAATLAPAAP